MGEKRLWIPIGGRKQNRVDGLHLKIKQIQKKCKHDFRILGKPRLTESLVPGIYVGFVAMGGGTRGIRGIPSCIEQKLVCLKCSKEKIANIVETCPKCLGSMKQGEVQGVYSRIQYFGEDYLYYSIVLSKCSNCGFTIASDTWNQ